MSIPTLVQAFIDRPRPEPIEVARAKAGKAYGFESVDPPELEPVQVKLVPPKRIGHKPIKPVLQGKNTL